MNNVTTSSHDILAGSILKTGSFACFLPNSNS